MAERGAHFYAIHLTIAHFCAIQCHDKNKLIKRVRQWAKDHAVSFEVDEIKGKGSHVRVFVGDRSTIVKHGELSPAYVDLVLKQLGIPKDDIKR